MVLLARPCRSRLAMAGPNPSTQRRTVSVQLLDGVGVGVFGALFPVVVADLTRGSGHFAAAQGVVGTAHQIGAMASMALGGALAAWGGYGAAFLALAAVAALGAVVFWLFMPETQGAPAAAVPGPAAAARPAE